VQPKIYPVDEHLISSDKIDPNASYVIIKLRQAGHKAYLVGGAVRDTLLGIEKNKDIDMMVLGSGLAFARAFAEEVGEELLGSEPTFYRKLTS